MQGTQPLYPGSWIGTLVLPPAARRRPRGDVMIRVEQAPAGGEALVGRTLDLHWNGAPQLPGADCVHFTPATRESERQGNVHPDRLDGWDHVSPLESLAGGHATDDVRVQLPAATAQLSADQRILNIASSPTQIGATHIALGHIDNALPDRLQVTVAGTAVDLPLNLDPNRFDLGGLAGRDVVLAGVPSGQDFAVTALRPRDVLQVAPQRELQGTKACERFLRDEMWADPSARTNQSERVLLSPSGRVAPFVTGERYLLLHVYGEVRGSHGDAVRPLGIVPGHFAYGTTTVADNPLSGEAEFNMRYQQVYANGPKGVLSVAQDWDAYMGDVAAGQFANRPVCDIVVRHPALQRTHEIAGHRFQFFEALDEEESRMEARYRTGNGTGLDKVTSTTSCTQDSAQAMYAVLTRMKAMADDPAVREWMQANPNDVRTRDFQSLLDLGRDLRSVYTPVFGIAPGSWKANAAHVAAAAPPLGALGRAVTRAVDATLTCHTIFPRAHQDRVARTLLRHDADLMVLRSNGMSFPQGSWPVGPNYPFSSRYAG